MQFACFKCRKSFERPQMGGANDHFMTSKQQSAQWKEAEMRNSRSYKCPDCGGQSYFMGIDFKAPKKSDDKAWRKVEKFILSGKQYYRGVPQEDV